MGFDNECILNIQSLAGEYFCPVCRLLVYPNEALQSQCTHLYCKPCLTYVVSTTRACPYDGYLVTEADSKPLTESNKALAETIGKIPVHCLFHRSGCTWQGTLSDCTSHCSGCAFGNSPVVCNRCGVQIVHRQVQEHAQICPGVQAQAQPAQVSQDAAAAGNQTQAVAAAGNQTQAVAATTAPQLQTSGVTTSSTAGSAAPGQSVVQATAQGADHWYQQQQQYQQYYQQYHGYDPYQQQYQQYYPHAQQAVPQYQQPQQQAQPQVQPQLQPQTQPIIQPPITAQPQSLPNPPQQTFPSVQPQLHTQLPHPAPQPPSQPQSHPIQPQNLQMPQYQQPFPQLQQAHPQIHPQVHSQLQPQIHPQPQSQTHVQSHTQPAPQALSSQTNQAQVPSAHAVTGHHSYPQAQPHQQIQPSALQLPVPMHPQGGPQQQSQLHIQMQSQFPQQPPILRPLQQPGFPLHQQPVQSVQHPMQQQYGQYQQPFPGQPSGPVQSNVQGSYLQQQQQLHVQQQIRPLGPPQSFQQNVMLPHGLQPHQIQNPAGRPAVLPHGMPVQPYPQPTFGMQVRPTQSVANQQSGNIMRTADLVQSSSEQKSGTTSGPLSESQGTKIESPYQKTDKKVLKDVDVASGHGSAGELKSINAESDLNAIKNEGKSVGDAKEVPESLAAEGGEHGNKQVKEETSEGRIDGKDVSSGSRPTQTELSVSEDKDMKDEPLLKASLLDAEHPEMKMHKYKHLDQRFGGFPPHGQGQSGSLVEQQGKQQLPSTNNGPSGLQQRPHGPTMLQAPSHGTQDHTHLPGFPPAQVRPSGTGHMTQPGQAFNPPPGHLLPAGGFSGPDFGKGPSHTGPLHGPYTQGHVLPTHGEGIPSEMFPEQRPGYLDGRQAPLGQHSGMHPNAVRMNVPPALDSTSTHGLRDGRFRPLADEHLNVFPEDPSRYRREFEEGFKHFPRLSHLDREPVPTYGPHFSSSRPLDRGPPSFGADVAPRPLGKEPYNLDPLGGPRRFPPYLHDGTLHPTDLGERPAGFREARPDSALAHKDFLGPDSGHGRRHMDVSAARSPGVDYPGLPSRAFGGFPLRDDIGRESRRFADPIDSSLHDSRFRVFPGHFPRGEFEASGILMGDHARGGEFIGPDGPPNHLRRADHLGPHNLPTHLRLRDGFGGLPGQMRMGELAGSMPGNFRHPRFGEPGFRSSFSLKGFPSDGGRYTGNMESFDNSRKRKPTSMGWCRICKVDCETVEGLELHSQTRDHQKMAMDMVLTIKQNAKKQKKHDIPASDKSTQDENSEVHGSKH